jgi:Zn-dependent peptidase ImmA (M78 family)/transcriptional regulator with XRE-family HTH domain
MIDNYGDSPQLALDNLEPERITFARELRGLTKKELAQKIAKTSSAVSQIERGLIRPDLETLVRMSLALSVPTMFFMNKGHKINFTQLETCHFRSKRSTSLLKRKQSARIGDLLIEFIETLEQKGIVFPEDQISPYTEHPQNNEDIERTASNLRATWNMGKGPIPNMLGLLESRGAFVLPINEECEDVDAYSTWKGKRPCVMLLLNKSASRARFDAAHELGHLIMHDEAIPGDPKAESQADRFAGAFLAPRESFLSECPRQWNLKAFMRLKFRWKMSIQALVYRAYDLGCLTRFSYRKAFIDLTQLGLRKNEGEEWVKEKPILIQQAIELLKDSTTLNELAEDLSIFSSYLRELLKKGVCNDLLDQIDRKKNENEGTIVSLNNQNKRS